MQKRIEIIPILLLKGWIGYTLAALLIILSTAAFKADRQQAAHWRGTYFSFAAHLVPTAFTASPRFLVDTAEVNLFDKMPPQQQRAYRFRNNPALLTEYVFMQIGYGYMCVLARLLFPYNSDSTAIVGLQTLVHLWLCLYLLSWLSAGWKRWYFLLAYACNPLIIRYVTYDFYYFWQVIPSFLLVYSQLGWRGKPGWGGLLGPLLGLLFVMRPSVALAQGWLGMIWARQGRWRLLLLTAALAMLVGGWLYRPVASAPYRPMYVGIAAYSNPYMNNMSDVALYDLYQKHTGTAYQFGTSDKAQEARLTQILRQQVSLLVNIAPWMFLKNAFLNTLEAFSVGYVAGGGDAINYASALVGCVVLGLLLRFRQYVYILGILATVGTFTPYYPPIPAYMYGAYLLLLMGLLPPIDALVKRAKARRRLVN